MRRISAFLAVALLSLAFTGSAYAQSATEDAYSGVAGVQQFGGGDGAGGEAAVVSDTSSSGSLPFTGLDVGLIVLAGVALVGTGLVIRRVSQPSLKA